MTAKNPFIFVTPENSDEVSGGNLYNTGLQNSLQNLRDLRCLDLAQWQNEEPRAGVYLIDTLHLAEFEKMLSRRVPGQRFVLLVHHLPSLEPGLAPDDPARLAETRVIAHFDAYLATSQFTSQLIRSRGYGERVITIEPPLPANDAGAKDYLGPVRALMACNLIPRKGVLEFLEALSAAIGEHDRFRLDIVGRTDPDANYGLRCADTVAAHVQLSERVKLRGFSPYGDMRGWFEGANLFASASRMETFGIALQEARHFGLPILTVQGGNSATHVEPGVTGEFFSCPTRLARGFIKLVRDEQQLSRYYANAQRSRPAATETWAEAAARFVSKIDSWFPVQG